MLNEKDLSNLEEILYAISHIKTYLKPVSTLEELLQNELIYDAVQMNFILIGEASKRISKELKTENSHIDWKGMISYRNFVVHEYFGVDVKILWAAINFEIPKLESDLKLIIENH